MTWNKRANLLVILGLVMAALCPLFAQEAGVQPPSPPPAENLSLLDLIKQGGWAMWPLGICSFGLIAMIVMNSLQINQRKMMPQAVVDQIRTAAQNRDLGQVWQLSTSTPSLFTDALSSGLRHVDTEDPAGSKQLMEQAIAEAIGREESLAGFWINFLSLIAGVAPMIGLLGTVSGMIGAFQQIGSGGMGKPEVLAADIGEALMTTATGLVIAIPAMFSYFLFRNILNRIIIRAEAQFTFVLDELTGTGLTERTEA